MKEIRNVSSRPSGLHILLIAMGLCVFVLKIENAFAGIDIRTNLDSSSQDVEIAYIASISDCSELISMSFTAGYSTGEISVSDMTPSKISSRACEATFYGFGRISSIQKLY